MQTSYHNEHLFKSNEKITLSLFYSERYVQFLVGREGEMTTFAVLLHVALL